MISGINNINQSLFQPQVFQRKASEIYTQESLNPFGDEDEAIISSQAKLLNELDKFNSGADNLVDLMGACVMSKITVEAEVNVIQAKKDMLDCILDMGKSN